jgi:hypothetical protein
MPARVEPQRFALLAAGKCWTALFQPSLGKVPIFKVFEVAFDKLASMKSFGPSRPPGQFIQSSLNIGIESQFHRYQRTLIA